MVHLEIILYLIISYTGTLLKNNYLYRLMEKYVKSRASFKYKVVSKFSQIVIILSFILIGFNFYHLTS